MRAGNYGTDPPGERVIRYGRYTAERTAAARHFAGRFAHNDDEGMLSARRKLRVILPTRAHRS